MLFRATSLILCLLLASCEQFTLLNTPKKQAQTSHTALAQHAEKTFWDTLHAGNYTNIPEAERLLTAAYLENPNDPSLAAHLGFIHIWKITERQRQKNPPPTIVNDIILAKNYFADAVSLNPHDARTQGFLGDSLLVKGQIFANERDQVRGYFRLKHAIAMWPEFNYFTAGYPMSTLDVNSAQFKEGLAWQWQTLSLCAGTPISKNNPDFSPYMASETTKGPKRACWNSWIAPYNFEGFFLNMGDMLVKQGDWQTAIRIYNNAKLSKDYPAWPYRPMLENRIREARTNVARFRSPHPDTPAAAILFNSGKGCVVCHQQSRL